ncbi:MAG TPA: hypothetical protein VJ624_05055 [Thermodesulfobacteriota bacterium]|nr:hypothetical protein [Thermodesulfobacteriota bacterium]
MEKKFRKNIGVAIMKKLLLALFFTIVIVSPLNAQSTLAQQEKCATGGKKFFLSVFKTMGVSGGASLILKDMGGIILQLTTIRNLIGVLYGLSITIFLTIKR